MTLRILFALALLLGGFSPAAWSQQSNSASARAGAEAAVLPRMVMTWVPPYDIPTSQQQLQARYGKTGPSKGLTHLSLQFWVPSPDGGLARSTRYGSISDEVIQSFVRWGNRNGIKVMLCVYNGEYGWNWALAKNAFQANRKKFVNALVREMQRLRLHGIDVDLEGLDTDYPAIQGDKTAYVRFIKDLAPRVHAREKQITLDTFHYIDTGPTQNWWAALFPHVDGITSMGYGDLGRNAPDWQSYAAQKTKAGRHSAKLLIGMPSDVSTWQGNTATEQAAWFLTQAAGRTGVAIWDARFLDSPENPVPEWQAAPVWKRLQAVRND